MTLLLAAVVWRWGKELWGPWAGLLALGVLAFDPTLIAHGRLATNDVGVTALGTCALYVIWRWTKRPQWYMAAAAGALLAGTMLAKGSGVLWTAAAGAMMLWVLVRQRRGRDGWLPAQAILAGTVSLMLLWAAYGFSWGPLGEGHFSVPAPLHWQGILHHPQNMGQKLVFALGRRTYGRWWWYFPLTFALKTPLHLLITLIAGLVAIIRRVRSVDLVQLALFPVLYAAVAITIGKNVETIR